MSFALAAILAGGIVTLVVVSSFIPAETVRRAVIAEIRSVTGLEPVVRGDVSVSLFPSASVSFTDVVLGDDHNGRPALAADRLTAKLSLLPLLFGRIETADMALTRPRVIISLEPDGSSNWASLTATLARTLKGGGKQSDHVISLSEVRMSGGTIEISDAAHGISETLSDVEVSLAWPSIARSLTATGRFVWHDEPFDLSASAADLLAALTGERSGLKVRLAGSPFKLAFDGHMSYLASLKVEGTLSADGASLRQALRWAGRQPLPGGGFGLFALKAQTSLIGGTFALTQVNIELDGNSAEGVLSFSSEPRVTVKGTLAADTLDLSPYVSTVEVIRSDRDWSRRSIAMGGLTDFDLDLRLSAARITVGNVRLGRTGVAANLRDGRLTFAIGEAQAFGGVLKGSVLLAKADSGADVKALLQFNDVDLETCLGEVFGIRRLEGKGDIALALDASGDTVFAFTQTLSGTTILTAREGALGGFNVEQLLKRLEQRPLSIGGDFRRGRTPFDKLTVMLRITQGIASVEDVLLEGGPVKLKLAGLASIPSRELDLKGTASLVSTNDGTTAFELPFVVQGQWDDPIVLPDARSLIRRSNAAAPLLDAVRDRKTRDAVRDVIERLSRDGAVTPVPAGPAPAAATSEPVELPPAAAATPPPPAQ